MNNRRVYFNGFGYADSTGLGKGHGSGYGDEVFTFERINHLFEYGSGSGFAGTGEGSCLEEGMYPHGWGNGGGDGVGYVLENENIKGVYTSGRGHGKGSGYGQKDDCGYGNKMWLNF